MAGLALRACLLLTDFSRGCLLPAWFLRACLLLACFLPHSLSQPCMVSRKPLLRLTPSFPETQ
jgi:hypothetical protein